MIKIYYWVGWGALLADSPSLDKAKQRFCVNEMCCCGTDTTLNLSIVHVSC